MDNAERVWHIKESVPAPVLIRRFTRRPKNERPSLIVIHDDLELFRAVQGDRRVKCTVDYISNSVNNVVSSEATNEVAQ